MYFVGIDISKFKHDCAVIDEIGDTILPRGRSATTARAFPYLGRDCAAWRMM